MIKHFSMIKRKKGLTRERFLRHWEEIHGPLVVSKNIPGLRRYVQNHTVPDVESDIDGIAELWYDDIESAQSFVHWLWSSDEAEDLREDIRLFINIEESFILFAEEHVMKKMI